MEKSKHVTQHQIILTINNLLVNSLDNWFSFRYTDILFSVQYLTMQVIELNLIIIDNTQFAWMY